MGGLHWLELSDNPFHNFPITRKTPGSLADADELKKNSTHLPGETGRLSEKLRGGCRLVNIAGARHTKGGQGRAWPRQSKRAIFIGAPDRPLPLLFDQFHPPVFGLSIRRVVRCDRRKGRHAIRIHASGGDPVFARQAPGHRLRPIL